METQGRVRVRATRQAAALILEAAPSLAQVPVRARQQGRHSPQAEIGSPVQAGATYGGFHASLLQPVVCGMQDMEGFTKQQINKDPRMVLTHKRRPNSYWAG